MSYGSIQIVFVVVELDDRGHWQGLWGRLHAYLMDRHRIVSLGQSHLGDGEDGSWTPFCCIWYKPD